MKLFKSLAFLMLMMPFAKVVAQTENDFKYITTNVDENGKRMRGTYLTNPWYSNWSIELNAGAQTLISGTDEHNLGFDFGTARLTPSYELSISKWFTPVAGVRLGAQGLTLKEKFAANSWNHYPIKSEDGINYYNEFYVHGDFLWNIENTVWGYRSTRFLNVSPYVHVGYLRLSHPDKEFFTNEYRDREFEFGFGVLNTFRITDSFLFDVDLRWGNIAGRFHDSYDGGRVNHFTAMAGIQYNIDIWYWLRSKGMENDLANARNDVANAIADVNAARAAEEQARAAEEAAKRELEQLKQENEDLKKNRPADAQPGSYENLTNDEFSQRVSAAGLIVYYQINLSKLNFSERHHLDDYVKVTLQNDPEHVFYLTGSADKGTGTIEINTRLSHDRAAGIKKILMEEYNVPEDQVVIKATIISDKHKDGSLDRCVLFENE